MAVPPSPILPFLPDLPLRCKVEGISVLSVAAAWRRHPPDPVLHLFKRHLQLRSNQILTGTLLVSYQPSCFCTNKLRHVFYKEKLRLGYESLIGVTDSIYKRWDVGIGGKRERVLQTSRGNKVSPILLCRPPLIADKDNIVLRGNFANETFFVAFRCRIYCTIS